ncbi:Papain-like cysteine peptidase [Pandoravirus salinus]|uniref:Papain-like cysteine peptidase n=1 Tax=Pandoravirus salinus TaxID=1349410 RepID=A0A291ATR7_9VIRU|nr:Peptidase domain containing protein [Pandoravirus salinus]ATE82178.1 Papain-like cysteine peptidase [Pandoravirus salinus]
MGLGNRDRRHRRPTRRQPKRRRPPRSTDTTTTTTTASDTFLSTLSSSATSSTPSSPSPPSSPLSSDSSSSSSYTTSPSFSSSSSPSSSPSSSRHSDTILLSDSDKETDVADFDDVRGRWRRRDPLRSPLPSLRPPTSLSAPAQPPSPLHRTHHPPTQHQAPVYHAPAPCELMHRGQPVSVEMPMPILVAPPHAAAHGAIAPDLAESIATMGPRPAFTLLRGSTPAAAREYASLPLVRPWRELARAVDPTGRLPLDTGAVWAGDAEGALALPAQFDGRRRWGRLLAPARDQGLSGACWAFALVSALGDRAALWTHGAVRAWPDGIPRPGVFGGLAARDIVDRDFDALTDAQTEGEADIVSANEIHHGHRHADYGHTLAGAAEVLYVGGVTCEGGWRCRPLAHYALASATEMDVKAEIFAWGPVASAFALHEDFMYPERHPASWIGGVYRHDEGSCPRVFGGHAVVLVGWCEARLPPVSPESSALYQSRHAPDHTSAVKQHQRHTCWIARHAWGPGWAGGAHPDGHFVMVAGQCQLEANVVACVPDVAGLTLDPRDAHRVAPPSVAARRRRSATAHPSESDLIGPMRVDPSLLCDMGAFIAAEVYGPWDAAGTRPRVGAHDGATTYADGRWPASDAWTTALRRAWTAEGDRAAGTHWSNPQAVPLSIDEWAREADNTSAPPRVHKGGVDERGFGSPLGGTVDDGPTRHEDSVALAHSMQRLAVDAHTGASGRPGDRDDHPLYDSHAPDPFIEYHDFIYDPAYGPAYGDEEDNDDDDRDADGSDRDDVYSNSDAELSDDERQADARHRLLSRRYRRDDPPPPV